jgi:hypothetical protein
MAREGISPRDFIAIGIAVAFGVNTAGGDVFAALWDLACGIVLVVVGPVIEARRHG